MMLAARDSLLDFGDALVESDGHGIPEPRFSDFYVILYFFYLRGQLPSYHTEA